MEKNKYRVWIIINPPNQPIYISVNTMNEAIVALKTLAVDFVAENLAMIVIFLLGEILSLFFSVPDTVGPLNRFFDDAGNSELNPYCLALFIVGISLSILVLIVFNWRIFIKNLQIQNMEEMEDVSAKKKYGYTVLCVVAVFFVFVIGIFFGLPKEFFLALSYPFMILLGLEVVPYFIITVFLPIIPISKLAVSKLGIRSKFLRIIAIILGAIIFVAIIFGIVVLIY